MLLTDIEATELQAGDIWTSDKDDVLIESVATQMDHTVRFTGKITRGFGRSNKLHTWVVQPTQRLDVVRHVE